MGNHEMNILHTLANVYVRMARLITGIDRIVVFVSFSGKSYSDNPRAISEALHEMAPNVKIYWLLQKGQARKCVPEYIKCVDVDDKIATKALLARAACLVQNCSMPTVPKSKKQLFIQTWHGDKAFKKVLYDASPDRKKYSVSEEIPGYCDLAIAGSEYGKRQFETAFRYTGKILMEGTPRNDRLVCPDAARREHIREMLEIDKDEKILLYAPTLRWEQQKSRENQPILGLNITRTLDVLEQRDNHKWRCLLRAHPVMIGLTGAGDDCRIKDVSSHPDMADLLELADMLITDYSSCAGDFLLTGRPVLLFQGDLAEYQEKDRGLYFEMQDSPYWAVGSQTSLEERLLTITPESAKENCKKVLAFYGDCETGHASESVARIIKEWVEK